MSDTGALRDNVKQDCDVVVCRCENDDDDDDGDDVVSEKSSVRPELSGDCRCDGEADALRILDRFKKIYDERIAEIDDDPRPSDCQRNQLKLNVMTDWVKDLGEQNVMLVQTVRDLEQAAVGRVKLLKDKLHVTSSLISQSMSYNGKSEEDLIVLSNRISHLANDQNDVQKRIDYLQSDIENLLKLIKRGRTENNWDLDGITFYEVRPSDIPRPVDRTCSQITDKNNKKEDITCDKRALQIKSLSEKLQKTEKILHEQKWKENELENKIAKMHEESESFRNKIACLEKEFLKSREALSAEIDQKHETILCLNNDIKQLEIKLCESVKVINYKDKVIQQLKEDLRKCCEKDITIDFPEDHVKHQTQDKIHGKVAEGKVAATKRKVRISDDGSEKTENISQNALLQNQDEILNYLCTLKSSMERDSEIILNLKTEYETVLNSLKNTKRMHEKDVFLANEKLLDIKNCLNNYRCEVIEQSFSKDNIKEFITAIEKKINFVEKLFQNNCKQCIKENVQSEIKDMISKVSSGIQKLSEIHETKCKISCSISKMVSENKVCKKNTMNKEEQKAIFAAIAKQYRMMDEFRLCTVEVQAATEDLHEEVSEVISNLNSRHCKYMELDKMVSQIQDCLTKTRCEMAEIINHLELQDEERVRHTERITNNRIRLKDIKNEFNRTQTELSKCLSNVHNNIQQNNLSGYAEVNTCNDLLISVAEEVEQIVDNLQTFQSQGCCTLETMNELKNQLAAMELSMKEFKRRSDHMLKENCTAKESCEENLKLLEKYECQVDNCHSKMQEVLECIVAVQDQMNEFGCIQESENSHESTNETIKLKEDLRKLKKECKELKLKDSLTDGKRKKIFQLESKIVDLKDQIQVLQNELKCKQQSNNFLKQSIETLETKLKCVCSKAEDNRRCSSLECTELKKKILVLENSLRIQKDIENNLKCLVNNETDYKKSQLLEFVKDRHCDNATKPSLRGANENISQLFKGLQDNIQTIKSGLQELTDKLKSLVPEESSYACNRNISIHAATEILAKYIESIKNCFYEIEKIKTVLNSKDKLMENMDKIIKIQKDSITISQSEVEDVHKTLQEKIEAQEKTIAQVEKEKRHLSKQVELQVQTIGHLQNAVVEAKKTIDQLTNKSASDNLNKSQIIKSLNLHLSETQSQYNDCYGEASEQGNLLEQQRDAISALQKKIRQLECEDFLHAFILHFIYYVIMYKYQEEMDVQKRRFCNLQSKIKELECAKINSDKQSDYYRCKYEELDKEIERMGTDFEDARKILRLEKQSEINELSRENDDLKRQLRAYRLDFDLIDEEMKKMGIVDRSIENFRTELDALCAENDKFKCDAKNYRELLDEYKRSNDCMSRQMLELQQNKDACVEKYKGKIMSLQTDVVYRNGQIKELKCELTKNETMIRELLHVIDENKKKIHDTEQRSKKTSNEIDANRETIDAMDRHISSLKVALEEKANDYDRLRKYYRELKSDYCIFKSKAKVNDEKYKNELSSLRLKLKQSQNNNAELKKCYERVSASLNKHKGHLAKLAVERRLPEEDYRQSNTSTCDCDHSSGDDESTRNDEDVKKLRKKLNDFHAQLETKNRTMSEIQSNCQAMTNKCDNYERSFQHQRNEIMLLEKKLACVNQKFQNCTDKNDELIRQNKSFEDSNNNCMAELEDIVLQLEDMQSSLVDLRTECDNKSQALDCVSAELIKMKISRSEVCDESKHVLDWLRRWMREQKFTAAKLKDKLRERRRVVRSLRAEKRNAVSEIKRLRRVNRQFVRKLIKSGAALGRTTKISRIVNRCSLPVRTNANSSSQKISSSPIERINGFRDGNTSLRPYTRVDDDKARLHFEVEFGELLNVAGDKITGQGDCAVLCRDSGSTNEAGKIIQIDASNDRNGRRVCQDTTDHDCQA